MQIDTFNHSMLFLISQCKNDFLYSRRTFLSENGLQICGKILLTDV